MIEKKSNIYIGTSGWHYRHWKGSFYPQDISNEHMLEYYLKYFNTAEVNNTFYQLPRDETMQRWRNAVPEDFIFSVKASRYITHIKKLKDTQEPLSNFVSVVEKLGNNLGPILFQLPPRWKKNLERLSKFLADLPDRHRYAFEFRDKSWFAKDTEELLIKKNAAFCIYDFEQMESPHTVTADFIYVRLHGPEGAYRGKYDDMALSKWAGELLKWVYESRDVYCYFDNDQDGYAAINALCLKKMVEEMT